MKPSRYNIFYRVDDTAILGYNTFSTALVSLSEEEFACYQAFCQDPSNDVFAAGGMEELRVGLFEANLLVPDELDELARLAAINAATRQGNRQLSLTIIPTLACNCRCSYCFSYARPGRMTSDVQEGLLRFVAPMLVEANRFTVAWYGGEPLTCLKIIEGLATSLHKLCAMHDISTPGDSIVTNGYLLNRRTAERLKAAGVTRAQVTLDGDRATHNERRPLANGRSTFDHILDNLGEVCDLLDIQVRINVDRANAESAVGALDALSEAGLQGKVTPYFGHVKPLSEACGDISGNCLTGSEFSVLDLELTKQALVRGFGGFRYPRSAVGSQCIADHPLGYVVDPDGLLYKCWAEASRGPEWSVGCVFDTRRTPEQEATMRMYIDADPLDDTRCGECRLLPLCMGGCPHLRLRGATETDCAKWRYTLGETLAIRYKLRDRFRLLPMEPVEATSPVTSSSKSEAVVRGRRHIEGLIGLPAR